MLHRQPTPLRKPDGFHSGPRTVVVVSKFSEMGRTIHDTWGVADRALKADWSDPAIPRAIADEMRQNWLRQQAIRDGERRVRRRGALPPQPVSPEQVPIVIEDDAPHLRYGATEEDIRAVFRRLPPGSLDGLQEVRLCLDREDARRGTRVRDPFIQRLRHELVPGSSPRVPSACMTRRRPAFASTRTSHSPRPRTCWRCT